jgi:hypothetical protein
VSDNSTKINTAQGPHQRHKKLGVPTPAQKASEIAARKAGAAAVAAMIARIKNDDAQFRVLMRTALYNLCANAVQEAAARRRRSRARARRKYRPTNP